MVRQRSGACALLPDVPCWLERTCRTTVSTLGLDDGPAGKPKPVVDRRYIETKPVLAARQLQESFAGGERARRDAAANQGAPQVSAANSDGAWELPHEFRAMQDTARRFMRERVR